MRIFLSLAFISWFVLKISNGVPLCERQSLFLLLGLFVISSSVSAFDSGYPLLAARGIIKLLKYILVMLVALDLFRDPNRLRRLVITATLSCSAVLIDTAFQRIVGRDLNSKIPLLYADQQARVTGPF